jgi:hypothetical protein
MVMLGCSQDLGGRVLVCQGLPHGSHNLANDIIVLDGLERGKQNLPLVGDIWDVYVIDVVEVRIYYLADSGLL